MLDNPNLTRDIMQQQTELEINLVKQRVMREQVHYILPDQMLNLILNEVHLTIFLRFCKRINRSMTRIILADLEESDANNIL